MATNGTCSECGCFDTLSPVRPGVCVGCAEEQDRWEQEQDEMEAEMEAPFSTAYREALGELVDATRELVEAALLVAGEGQGTTLGARLESAVSRALVALSGVGCNDQGELTDGK